MKQIKTICALLVIMVVMVSCLNSASSDTTLYDDAAISGFSLGTLNRYVHTTSSVGTDSVYKTTVTGSNYTFHIDQVNHLIFNTDSLPLGTDVAHVICTVTSKNNSIVLIKDMESDTLRYYSSTDSIDFSQPREFQLISSDGEGYSKYMISVNAHQEEASDFVWTLIDEYTGDDDFDGLAKMKQVKVAAWGDRILLSGQQEDGTSSYYSWSDNNHAWILGFNTVYPLPLNADAWKNVVVKGDYIFLLDGSKLWKMTTILEKQYDTNLKQLLGASTTELYALSNDDKLMVSNDDGETWEEDLLDEDASMLPVQDISMVCYPMSMASKTDYVLMAGNRSESAYPQESIAMVWRKIVDYEEYAPESWWTYMERSDNNQLALPRLQNLSLAKYDDGILAIGGAGIGGSTKAAYSQIYQSRDNGITWKYNEHYQLPDGFDTNATSVAMLVDNQQHLWLFCGGTGQVWRGHLNRLGWKIQD